MDNLSSHALFHFTRTEDTLKRVLLNGLRFSPVGEAIPGASLKYIVDAICFCNIPLSAVSSHVDWYGSYGIGFTPMYCKKIGATPVCYVHSSSSFLFKGRNKKALYENWNLTPYLKRTCGMQFKYHCHNPHWKDFYDEKEWRIVNNGSLTIYSKSELSNLLALRQTIKDECTSRLQSDYSFAKYFSWDDIEYIILPSKRDITPFIAWMNQHSIPYDVQRRIITIEEISNDF